MGENIATLKCCLQKLLQLIKSKCGIAQEEDRPVHSGSLQRYLQLKVPPFTKELFVIAVSTADVKVAEAEEVQFFVPSTDPALEVKINTLMVMEKDTTMIKHRPTKLPKSEYPEPNPEFCGLRAEFSAQPPRPGAVKGPEPVPILPRVVNSFVCDVCARPLGSLVDLLCHKEKEHSVPSNWQQVVPKSEPKVAYLCSQCNRQFKEFGDVIQHECAAKLVETSEAPSELPENPQAVPKLAGPGKAKGKAAKGKRPLQTKPANNIPLRPVKQILPDLDDFDNVDSSDKVLESVTEEGSEALVPELSGTASVKQESYAYRLCRFCKSYFTTHADFLEHRKICFFKKNCPICGREFTFQFQYKIHMRSHSTDRPFKCNQCSAGFKSKKVLLTHKEIHKEKRHMCHICSKVFQLKNNLVVHIKKHGRLKEGYKPTYSTDYQCRFCSVKYSSLSHLKIHYETDHSVLGFHCVDCRATLDTQAQMRNHMKNVHNTDRDISCRLCGDSFVKKTVIDSHVRRHQVEVAQTREGVDSIVHLYSCVNCPKTFNSQGALMSHNQSHYNEPPLTCSFCNQSVENLDDFEAHIAEHDKEMPLELCTTCGSAVANLHLHECTQKEYRCGVCKRTFRNKQRLRAHSYKHTSKKPTKPSKTPKRYPVKPFHGDCSVCKRKFVLKSSLVAHLYAYHKKPCLPQKFPCEHCDREFYTRANLTNHLRTHDKEKTFIRKDYACSECSRTFSTKAHQIIHTQTHTTSAKVCPVCGKTYESFSWLQFHMRIHTGEGHTCPICDRVFNTVVMLKMHTRKDHSNEPKEPIKCELCDVAFQTSRDRTWHFAEAHADLSPGVCGKCGTGFPVAEDLEEHAESCDRGSEADEEEKMDCEDEFEGGDEDIAATEVINSEDSN